MQSPHLWLPWHLSLRRTFGHSAHTIAWHASEWPMEGGKKHRRRRTKPRRLHQNNCSLRHWQFKQWLLECQVEPKGWGQAIVWLSQLHAVGWGQLYRVPTSLTGVTTTHTVTDQLWLNFELKPNTLTTTKHTSDDDCCIAVEMLGFNSISLGKWSSVMTMPGYMGFSTMYICYSHPPHHIQTRKPCTVYTHTHLAPTHTCTHNHYHHTCLDPSCAASSLFPRRMKGKFCGSFGLACMRNSSLHVSKCLKLISLVRSNTRIQQSAPR